MEDFKFYYKDNPNIIFNTEYIEEDVIRMKLGLKPKEKIDVKENKDERCK